MPIRSLFGKTYHLIERSLDIARLRHGVIAGNVANLDTPGYRPKEINFDKALKDSLERNPVDLTRTHALHFGAQGGRYETSYEEHDERVDIDQEMSRLAENNLRYQADVEVLLRKFSMLKYGITEGGR